MWRTMFGTEFAKGKIAESDALLPSLQDLIRKTEELVFGFKPLLE